MFITSWTIDMRMNIQIWLLYRRYKSEWYNFWWATMQDIAACTCKVWILFGQACGQEECSQTTMKMTTTTDKSWLHRLATDILSWAKKHCRHVLLFIPCHLLIWASAGNQLMEWLPYLVMTVSICHINQSATSIAKHLQICSNLNHFSCISHWEQKCFHFRVQIKLSMVFYN